MTDDGMVKVWVNSDLSKNYSLHDDPHSYEQLCGNEEEGQSLMVWKVITMIDRISDKQL